MVCVCNVRLAVQILWTHFPLWGLISAGGSQDREWSHQPKGCRAGWFCGSVQNQKAHTSQQTHEGLLWTTGEFTAEANLSQCANSPLHAVISISTVMLLSGPSDKADQVQVWWPAHQRDRYTCTGKSAAWVPFNSKIVTKGFQHYMQLKSINVLNECTFIHLFTYSSQLEMEDEDTIDVFQQQTGGRC